ncbi:MAG: ornithine cyclodeaminase [Pseudomonadota bacterium]
MAGPRIIGSEVEPQLDWIGLSDALAEGHTLPRAEMLDSFATRGDDTILTRTAWIVGLGLLVKAATVFPGNVNAPSINGAVTLFSDADGTLEAVLDFHLVTKWKTAADSLLAARRLAPPKVSKILIVGAGTVARSLMSAYGAAFPEAEFLLWNRTPRRAEALLGPGVRQVLDLRDAVAEADIVATATMATEPLIEGAWLRPGQHLDLIGAYRGDMREVDDTALTRARLFTDAKPSAAHIGEIADPLARGVISDSDIIADFYNLAEFTRAPDDITIAKNAGGAHLDLMTAKYILAAAAS